MLTQFAVTLSLHLKILHQIIFQKERKTPRTLHMQLGDLRIKLVAYNFSLKARTCLEGSVPRMHCFPGPA